MGNWTLNGNKQDDNGNGNWYYYKCYGNFQGFWSNRDYQATIEYNKTIHVDQNGAVVDTDSHITAHITLLNKLDQQVSHHAVSYYYLTGIFTAFPVFFPDDLKTYIRQALQSLAVIN